MGRRHALLMRYTDFRSVSRTRSQSADFILAKRVSRVTPALLTRILTAPWRSPISVVTRSTESSWVTSSIQPSPLCPAWRSRSVIALAPSGVVAVPITMAPQTASSLAIASPIPRLAPVTSAISPWSPLAILIFLAFKKSGEHFPK